MLRIKGYEYLHLGSTARVQIGPTALLDLSRSQVLLEDQAARPATLGDLHRAALLLRWSKLTPGGRVGRRIVDAEGLWAIESIHPDHTRRIQSWA